MFLTEVSVRDLMYRKNKNPFQKEKRTDGHTLGLMGVQSSWLLFMYRKNKDPFQKEKRTDGHTLGLMGVQSSWLLFGLR